MFPVQSYWGNGNPNPTAQFQDSGEIDDSIRSSESKSETKSCKSHKEAERRRRQRINSHLSTLRSLLPNAAKTDKASLLAEVVRRVRELRRQVAEIAQQDGNGGGGGAVSWAFPGECDEASLSYCHNEGKIVKATVCSEDRPGLNRDLSRVIGTVRAKVVRAEMMTVGGRTKIVVVMEWAGGSEEEIRGFKRALRNVVLNRVSDFGLGYGDRYKRARIYGLDY